MHEQMSFIVQTLQVCIQCSSINLESHAHAARLTHILFCPFSQNCFKNMIAAFVASFCKLVQIENEGMLKSWQTYYKSPACEKDISLTLKRPQKIRMFCITSYQFELHGKIIYCCCAVTKKGKVVKEVSVIVGSFSCHKKQSD